MQILSVCAKHVAFFASIRDLSRRLFSNWWNCSCKNERRGGNDIGNKRAAAARLTNRKFRVFTEFRGNPGFVCASNWYDKNEQGVILMSLSYSKAFLSRITRLIKIPVEDNHWPNYTWNAPTSRDLRLKVTRSNQRWLDFIAVYWRTVSPINVIVSRLYYTFSPLFFFFF